MTPRSLPLLVATLGSLVGCRYAIHTVRDLPYERTVVIELDSPEIARLVLESHVGEVRLVRTPGPGRALVQVHERAPDLAQVWFEDGELRLEVLDDGDAYLGDITFELAEVLGDVVIGSGAGDVTLEGVRVVGELSLSTGAGDVRVSGAGTPHRISISTGAGNAWVASVDAHEIELSSGAGDLRLENVWCDRASLDSGVGTIRVDGSTIGDLEADTGVGDILVADTSTERRSLSTGIGSVHD